MKEMREALDAKPSDRGRLLLTAAFGMAEKYLENSYNIPALAEHLDYFHLMLYDFKMYLGDDVVPIDDPEWVPGMKLIGHHSPLFSKVWEDEGNQTMTTVNLHEILLFGLLLLEYILGRASQYKVSSVEELHVRNLF
jgi:hypothetical protein